MAQLTLNVAINDPELVVPVLIKESDYVMTLCDAFESLFVKYFERSPDRWSNFHILKAPQGETWSIDSSVPALVQNLDPLSCTELTPPAKDVATWFSASSVDKKCIHVLIVRKTSIMMKPIRDVGEVFRKHGLRYTSDLITIRVKQLTKWTENDVLDPRNAVKLLWIDDDSTMQAPLEVTRSKLDKMRLISDNTLLESKQYDIVNAITPHVFQTTADTDGARVSSKELNAFAALPLSYMDWISHVAKKSSHMKDGWFKSALVAPPMFELEEKLSLQNHYKFDGGVGWKFSFIVQSQEQTRKYAPNPDFLLTPVAPPNSPRPQEGFCPILLGEVVSDPNHESDRWRMLLQLAVCARINGIVTSSSKHYVVQAVYLNNQYTAERYLAYADFASHNADQLNPLPTVYILRDEFDVRTLAGAVKFLRSMYNFAELAHATDDQFNHRYRALCMELQARLANLPSLSSRSATAKTPKASVSQHGAPRISNIPEGPVTEMGYHISAIPTTRPHIAYASASNKQYVLKLVTTAEELSILTELHHASASNYHIIPIHQIFRIDAGTIISMPCYKPLNICDTLSVVTAANLCQQLLIALRFLHSRNIVHRDLKPENLVVDLERDVPQLYVIDFSLATVVEGRDDVTIGPVGTEGFTAPEVGFEFKNGKESLYCPMAADLWAAGKLVAQQLILCEDQNAPELNMLWRISALLTHDDPAQRPSAEDALAQFSSKAAYQPYAHLMITDSEYAHHSATTPTILVR